MSAEDAAAVFGSSADIAGKPRNGYIETLWKAHYDTDQSIIQLNRQCPKQYSYNEPLL
jgi:hypothetical protein